MSLGYFGVSEYYSVLPTLDEWLRRRVRLCYWKMWKKPGRRIRQLLKWAPASVTPFCGTCERKRCQLGDKAKTQRIRALGA